MRTLKNIKILKDQGKRYWAKDLVFYILNKRKEGLTYPEIANWLKSEHDISYNPYLMASAVLRYRKIYQDGNVINETLTKKYQEKPKESNSIEADSKNSEIEQYEELILEPVPTTIRKSGITITGGEL